MSRQDQFDRIVASLYEAALDDKLWHRTSTLIDEACGLTGTHLCLIGGATHGDAKWLFDKAYWRGESREELGRDYAENYFPGDERIPCLMALQDRHVVRAADLYTDRQLKTSPTYNELLRRAGAQDGLNIRMDGPDGIHIVWALADPVGRHGWSSEQLEMIERLLPHIRQFVRIRHTLIGAQALSTAFSGVLDSTMVAVLCLDWRGMIVQANSRACAILRQRDGLLDRGGFLCARLPADNLRLGRLLARVLPRSESQPAGGSMTVGRAQRGGPLPRLALHVTPVEVRDAGFGVGHVAALGADRRSGGEALHRPGACRRDPRPYPSRERGGGSARAGRHHARHRDGHAAIGQYRARTGQAHPLQAPHLTPRRLGAHGPDAGREPRGRLTIESR